MKKLLHEAVEYDERQLQIRGDVFKHGFFATMVMLLINALLNDYGIIWASGFHQNMIIIMLMTTVISVEAHLRGVYFGRSKGHRALFVLLLLGMLAGYLTGLVVGHFGDGGSFADEGMLSDDGFTLILCGLIAVNVAVGLIQHIRNRKNR
ncbi:MAG: hypothetical protein FWH20_08020 [Oscillospiraceae bacterium]|nr:hypothetical protein [Oscillospiraceae bacterium]